MTHHQHKLGVRTLGEFALVYDNKPVNVVWPDSATKFLFCSLLSPLDASLSRERLCKALWDLPSTETGNRRLNVTLTQLHDVMTRMIGTSPIIIQDGGIALDFRSIYVDAHTFHETAIAGFRELSDGNHHAAQRHFQTATTLYRGAFLPGMTGRIIAATRTELELQHQLLARQIKPLPPGPELKFDRTPAVFFCAG